MYDGSNSSAALVGRFNGYSLPGDIFSDSPLFIYFHTDGSVTDYGFKIRYNTSDYESGKQSFSSTMHVAHMPRAIR